MRRLTQAGRRACRSRIFSSWSSRRLLAMRLTWTDIRPHPQSARSLFALVTVASTLGLFCAFSCLARVVSILATVRLRRRESRSPTSLASCFMPWCGFDDLSSDDDNPSAIPLVRTSGMVRESRSHALVLMMCTQRHYEPEEATAGIRLRTAAR